MLTLYFFRSRTRPSPWQVWQGCSMTVPEPPHWWQGRGIENRPWPSDSTPRPLQTGQTIGEVPRPAPVPRQVGQAARGATGTGTRAPSTPRSKGSETGPPRSPPRPRAPPGRLTEGQRGRVPQTGPALGRRFGARPRAAVRVKDPRQDARNPAEVGRRRPAPGAARPAERVGAAEDRATAVVLLAL